MIFEDGSAPTLAALRLLESQKDRLNSPDLKVWSIPKFLGHARTVRLGRREKEILVEQATLLIDQFYAHLPFKRARYATDPVQRFRLIHAQLDQLSDLQFHDMMVKAFLRLRDAHTFYGLPAPYRGAFAFLPFRMDCYGEPGKRRFLVTNVLEGFAHERFGVGAEITLWQGTPLERAIEREASNEPGCNPASRFARGFKRMTKRNLAFTVPPDEQSVVIQYIPYTGGSEEYSIVLPWNVVTACLPSAKNAGSRSSVHESMAQLKEFSQLLWQREQMLETAAGEAKPPPRTSPYPRVFEFQYSGGPGQSGGVDPANLRDPDNAKKKFGYIRIKSFDLDSPAGDAAEHFVSEFKRILNLMREVAPDGVILDVRSNPGGSIEAAERILQLMTPGEIEPAKFHFINSRLTQQVASSLKGAEGKVLLDAHQREWHPWVEDLLNSVSSGLFVTRGIELTDSLAANDTGQVYQGPVTLIIDASSYSATDIFAAGFQDHGIGKVIGVDENTGGGGANRWLHADLLEKLKKTVPSVPLKKLPGDAQMGLAIRRSSRVGINAGNVIEDEGVKRDVPYQITRNDILQGDRDLLRFACAQLGREQTGLLRIVKAEALDPEGISLIVDAKNIFRIDCFVNGMQQCSFAAVEGVNIFFVPTGGLVDPPPGLLLVNGFALEAGPNSGNTLRMVARDTFRFEGQASVAPGATSVTAASQ